MGTAAAVVLPDTDFFSLDLADAALLAPGFAALAATFAVAPDELLVPPGVAALLATTQWVTASRLAQASAATSPARRCRVKSTDPRSPDVSLQPQCGIALGLRNPRFGSREARHPVGDQVARRLRGRSRRARSRGQCRGSDFPMTRSTPGPDCRISN